VIFSNFKTSNKLMNQHLKDTFRHKGKRKLLVEELGKMGIKQTSILDAFIAIPRHYFLDLAFDEQAYTNMAFQIGSGQTISHPYTVAFQTQLLSVAKGDKMLEIGTGSGFQTCILCQMGAKVFSVERHMDLHIKAKSMLTYFNFNAKLSFGDGYKGIPSHAPFDKILVTCGAPEIPQLLVSQLKIGGLMVIPVGEGDEQKMLRITKLDAEQYKVEEFGTFKFVPMLERTVKK
jgi:protein-L-isoaspartate(D-aspartate) O-methyltransferase